MLAHCRVHLDAPFWSLTARSERRKTCHGLMSLLRAFVARQLRDGSRLGLDAHLAVSLSNIPRTVTLNGVKDAVLNAGLNANSLEAVPPSMVRRNVLVGHHRADELRDPILDPRQGPNTAPLAEGVRNR